MISKKIKQNDVVNHGNDNEKSFKARYIHVVTGYSLVNKLTRISGFSVLVSSIQIDSQRQADIVYSTKGPR